MNKITKKRFLIECPFCEDGNICVECARTHITTPDEKDEKGCIVCTKIWDHDYIEYMFGEDTLQTYIDLHKTSLLKREKGLLAVTQPLVEMEIQKEELHKKKKEKQKEIATLHIQSRNLQFELRDIDAELNTISTQTFINKLTYVCPCPKNTCKGFVNRTNYTCPLCKTKVCPKCRMMATVKKHVCKKADIATANLIDKDTRPCPKCTSRIEKIDGCPQMFCVSCMTAFNWDTLAIITGPIHNPHYYDFVARGLISNTGRSAGDVPCGGMMAFSSVNLNKKFLGNLKLYTNIICCHRLACEIEDYLGEDLTDCKTYPELFTLLRIRYLRNYITEDEYRDRLYRLEIYVNQCKIEKEALETLITVFSGIFMGIRDEIGGIMTKKKSGRLVPIHIRRKEYRGYVSNAFEEMKGCVEMINEMFEAEDMGIITFSNQTESSKRRKSSSLEYRMNYNPIRLNEPFMGILDVMPGYERRVVTRDSDDSDISDDSDVEGDD